MSLQRLNNAYVRPLHPLDGDMLRTNKGKQGQTVFHIGRGFK